MQRAFLVGLFALSAWALPAAAQTEDLDLSKTPNVVKALQRAGYKAELKANKEGRPYISSAANGNNFTVEFFDCDKLYVKCGSLEFYGYWKKEPVFTAELVNSWNNDKRFLRIAIDKDGDLGEFVDMSVIGPVSYEIFADTLDWFVQMDGSLTGYLKEAREKLTPASAPKGAK